MSVGLGLLDALLRDSTLSVLSEHGIDVSFFVENEVTVFEFVSNYFISYAKLPTKETIKHETSVNIPAFPVEPIDYWISKLQERKASNILSSAISTASGYLKKCNVDSAKYILETAIKNCSSISNPDQYISLDVNAVSVMEMHDKRQKEVKMSGIPFGIPYLDKISDGAQKGDTIAICGRPSTGKTFLILYMASHALLSGHTALFVTCEMPVFQCTRRVLAIRNSISPTKIRLGKLGHWGRKKINLDITTLTENKNKMWFFKGTLASGLDDIIIAIQELKPDVVYTDGTYLLNKKGYYQSKWERVAAVAEELKKIASHFQIPVIETFQFNRKGSGSLDNIGGSDTVAQLASIALGLDDDEDEVANFSSSQYKRLELLKGREGEKGMVRMIFDMKKAIIAQDSVIYGEVQDEGE